MKKNEKERKKEEKQKKKKEKRKKKRSKRKKKGRMKKERKKEEKVREIVNGTNINYERTMSSRYLLYLKLKLHQKENHNEKTT